MRFLARGKVPCDVRFNVDGVVLEAHRLVVAAQSEWLLYGHGGEAGADTVDIFGTSPEAFAGVLHFVYNDELPPEATRGRSDAAYELATKLFVAADVHVPPGEVRRRTVETILELAEAHSCKELERACGMCPLSPEQN